jgi:hypothetical protein
VRADGIQLSEAITGSRYMSGRTRAWKGRISDGSCERREKLFKEARLSFP